MPATGIILADLKGIASLTPLRIYVHQRFSSTGWHVLSSEECPNGKLWLITFAAIGCRDDGVRSAQIRIRYLPTNTLYFLVLYPDLVTYKSEYITGGFWIKPRERLEGVFEVVSTSPRCLLTAEGFEFSFSE